MAVTGAIFGLTAVYPVLLVAAFVGTLGTSGSETAPFLPIEQAMLPQTGAPEQHTALFARYNLVATFAAAGGALVAGLPDLLTQTGVPLATGVRLLFGLYTLVALVVVLLVRRLSSQVELAATVLPARSVATGWQTLVPPLGRSRGIILRLSALFSVDALAGGLTVQSLMALYFHLRFGVPLAPLAALFFGANTLAALSFLAAAPLARRIGLLNTMVFTHLPSNVLLALVAVMPTGWCPGPARPWGVRPPRDSVVDQAAVVGQGGQGGRGGRGCRQRVGVAAGRDGCSDDEQACG